MIKKTILSVWEFYRDGFRQMTLGRSLWALILIKLFIMFFILKLFFFPSFLKGKSEKQKENYVCTELTERAGSRETVSSQH